MAQVVSYRIIIALVGTYLCYQKWDEHIDNNQLFNTEKESDYTLQY